MMTPFIFLVVLLIISGGFSSAETALFSVDSIRIQTLARQGNQTARLIQKLMADHRLLLGTILLGNTAANVGASAIATFIAVDMFGNAGVGIATGILTLVVLIFAEFIPKTLAAHSSEKAAFLFARPIFLLTIAFGPLVRLLDIITRFISPASATPVGPKVGDEEIKTLTQLGVKAGTIEKEEQELIDRVLVFSDITAEDVMTPEEEVQYLDGNETLASVVDTIVDKGLSRYPVFVDSEDNIIGILHIRDIFERMSGDESSTIRQVKVKDLAQTAMYVPETKHIDQLLRTFQKKHVHMALVVNEYGSIVGLITIEDLLEELVGEISDESDVDTHIIKRVDKHTVIVHGDIQVTDVNRFLNTSIDAAPNKTVNRLILEALGDLPEERQIVKINSNIKAEVLLVRNHHIQRVRLTKSKR